MFYSISYRTFWGAGSEYCGSGGRQSWSSRGWWYWCGPHCSSFFGPTVGYQYVFARALHIPESIVWPWPWKGMGTRTRCYGNLLVALWELMIDCACATHPVGNYMQRKRNRMNTQMNCFHSHPDIPPPGQMLIGGICMRTRAAVSAVATINPIKPKTTRNFLIWV